MVLDLIHQHTMFQPLKLVLIYTTILENISDKRIVFGGNFKCSALSASQKNNIYEIHYNFMLYIRITKGNKKTKFLQNK